MTKNITDASVIIVSYNTADLIGDCLSSVIASTGVEFEVFVVDNASLDASADIVREHFPDVRLIVNKSNRGFGAANNQALLESNGRYVILLNPDTIVGQTSFLDMVAYMDSCPRIGLAGPRVLNPDGTRQDSVSARYPGQRHGARDLGFLPGNIACVLGACQIIRTDLFISLGGFDEDFFLYGEDQDLCLRVRKRGFEIGHVLNAVIMHHGGQSERDTQPAEVVRKKVRAEFLFYRKHYLFQTAKIILKAQYLQALWRIFTIRLLLSVGVGGVYERRKLSRYLVIREEIDTWRRENNHRIGSD